MRSTIDTSGDATTAIAAGKPASIARRNHHTVNRLRFSGTFRAGVDLFTRRFTPSGFSDHRRVVNYRRNHWAIGTNAICGRSGPLLGVKQTSRFAPQMSANDPKRTFNPKDIKPKSV
jgi:hypothetical protein